MKVRTWWILSGNIWLANSAVMLLLGYFEPLCFIIAPISFGVGFLSLSKGYTE